MVVPAKIILKHLTMRPILRSYLENLLAALEKNHAMLISMKPLLRRAKIKEMCTLAAMGFDHLQLRNLQLYIDYLLEEKGTSVDVLIGLIKSKLFASFDSLSENKEEDRAFDSEFGTETATHLEQFELPEKMSLDRLLSSSQFIASPINSITVALELVTKHINTEDFTFIDVGSGLGRNLLIASHYPFKKIIGIEISEYLTSLAKQNISRYKSSKRKCITIETVCQDALSIQLPADSTVLYFFEPFTNEIGNELVRQVVQSVIGQPRPLILIFLGRVFPSVTGDKSWKRLEQVAAPDLFKDNKRFELSIFSYVNERAGL